MKEIALMAFYDDIGRILLENRKDISKFGEEYGFFGGGVEPGESKKQAVIREIEEELKYVPQDYSLLEVYLTNPKDDLLAREYLFIQKFPGFNKIKSERAGLFLPEQALELVLMPDHYNHIKDIQDYIKQRSR